MQGNHPLLQPSHNSPCPNGRTPTPYHLSCPGGPRCNPGECRVPQAGCLLSASREQEGAGAQRGPCAPGHWGERGSTPLTSAASWGDSLFCLLGGAATVPLCRLHGNAHVDFIEHKVFELEGTSEISSSRPLIPGRGAQVQDTTCPGAHSQPGIRGLCLLTPSPARVPSLRSQAAQFPRTHFWGGTLGA